MGRLAVGLLAIGWLPHGLEVSAATVVVDEEFDFFNGALWTDQVTRNSGFLQVTGGTLLYISLDSSASASTGVLGLRNTALTYDRPWSLSLDFVQTGSEIAEGGILTVGFLLINRKDPGDSVSLMHAELAGRQGLVYGLVRVDGVLVADVGSEEGRNDRHLKLFWDPGSRRVKVFSALDAASPLAARFELDLSAWDVAAGDGILASLQFSSSFAEIPWGECAMDRFVATLDDVAPVAVQAPSLHPSHDPVTGMFGLTFGSQANVGYVLEVSNNLEDWRQQMVVEAAPTDSRRFFTLPADQPHAFFRLRVVP